MSLNAVKECPNCSANLEDSFNYCPKCGQTTSIHRFNLPHIFHEIFHALTHADKGVLHLLKGLATRPGMVAREYILEGKRKKYFNPFTFLVLVLGLTLFANSIFHPYTRTNNPVQVAATRPYKSEQQKQFALKLAERQQTVQAFLEKRSNLIVFLAIPVITLAYWLFFFRTGINYAEHLVAQVFFSGFYSLFSTLVLTPIRQVFPEGNWFSITQLASQLVYLTLAYYQFLPPGRPKSIIKTALITLAGLMTWAVFSAGVIYLYVRFGG
ncbi:DUF3667 domain-containing protein [Larkinella punicea]|uniref:DUF3667 domain-containing protein n=1 Tax=Larkinella punicea TaxID=2315727 RepID=A0A368JLI4_9BACT|nr:DUF3667 domain-containing protein [Larkinella punicea]RCR67534.1 DUF3667 domain-containing protein [Larkinella punicea]